MKKDKSKEEPKTPRGRRGDFVAGGVAGRGPGLGNRNKTMTGSGGGLRERPAPGFAMSKFSPSRKPLNRIPPFLPKKPPKPKS